MPPDTVFDVSESSHVTFIIEHHDLFSTTLEDIRQVFARHGEAFGSEKGAREELIRNAAKLGLIRIRLYQKPFYWSIQCSNTKKQKPEILAFIQWAIASDIMRPDDSAVILGFENKEDRQHFNWRDGGISTFLKNKP
jgi:hypothetical protein